MKKLLILIFFAVSVSAQSFAQALMYNPWVENIRAGEDIDSISIPAWVYFSAVDGKAYLADNIVNRAQALVFAPIEADSAGQAMFAGIYEWPDSLDVGKSYYLTSTAGRTSAIRNNNATAVGTAVSPTRMLVAPGQTNPNGIDESIYTTNGTIPGNVARHISLDSAAAISITYPIGQPMLTLYSGDDSTCVNASVFMQSPDGDTEFLLNDANLVLGRNGNYTYYTDTSITSSVTIGAVTGSFSIKADITEVTKPIVLVGDTLVAGISDATFITRKWAEDNLSGGGGGSSDALGTGFTSGGGTGTIPDGTVATCDGSFDIDGGFSGFDNKLTFSPSGIGDYANFIGIKHDNDNFLACFQDIGDESEFAIRGSVLKDSEFKGQVAVYPSVVNFESANIVSNSNARFSAAAASAAVMQHDDGAGKVVQVTVGSGNVEVVTTTGALIPPRLTETQRDALTPSEGWTVHNTTTHTPQYYDGSAWQNTARPYKVYAAIINQGGGSDPVATVLENTLGGTVVWTRSDVGSYLGTLTGAFLEGKTWTTSLVFTVSSYAKLFRNDDDSVRLFANDGDGEIENTPIEIRVYN